MIHRLSCNGERRAQLDNSRVSNHGAIVKSIDTAAGVGELLINIPQPLAFYSQTLLSPEVLLNPDTLPRNQPLASGLVTSVANPGLGGNLWPKVG